MADYTRYKLVDYLPAMFMIEFIMHGKKPGEIVSYNTIIEPFDGYVWLFAIISMLAQFFTLCLMQNIWTKISGITNPKDCIFEGYTTYSHCTLEHKMYLEMFQTYSFLQL